MEWEETPNEIQNQIVSYGTEAVPSSSIAIVSTDNESAVIRHGETISGPRCLIPQEGGGNIFERIKVKHSKHVEFGATHHHYHQNITQVIHPSDVPVSQNVLQHQSDSSRVISDDDLLQNVPYLRSLYSTENAYMSSLLWDDDERDYSLKDYFIDLKLDEEDLLGKFKKRHDIPLENIFLPDKGERRPDRIIITGSPGYGKSTICSKLAYDWAMLEPPHYLSNFDILVVIPLHNLGKRTIEEAVVDILSDEETDIEKLRKSLCKSKHQFLVLLDGLDEATDITNIERSLKPHKNPIRFPKNTTILLTSRSHAAREVRKLFHRHLCVNGFTDEKQRKYIEMFFYANQQAQTSISELLLSEESILDEFAQCPLMLHMICCLHEEIDLSSLKRVTDMYRQVFRLFFIRYESKYDTHPLLQDGKYIKGEYFLLKLGKMCFDVLSGEISEITEKELGRVFNKQDEFDILLKIGLLKTSRAYSRGKIVITFEILHRVFLEFLAAFYFSFEVRTLQYADHDMVNRLLEHAFCENFLMCLAGLLREKFHLIISGKELDKYYEWNTVLCSRLLKECGHSKENMIASKQWLQRIDIDTSFYDHSEVDAALPLALKSKNSVTECICIKFYPLEEYPRGRYYVITPKLLRAMKECPTLMFVEIFIRFELLRKDGDDEEIAWVDLTACYPFLNKLLQMPAKEIDISVALHSDVDFDSYINGEYIEDNDSYKPLLLEDVNEGHELLEGENFIIRINQPGGLRVKFMIFPHEGLPSKFILGIHRPDFEDFTNTPMFKHILEVLDSKDMAMEIYLSEPEDMTVFDTKAYPLNT